MKLRLAAAVSVLTAAGLVALTGCGTNLAPKSNPAANNQTTGAPTTAAPVLQGKAISLAVLETALGPTLTYNGLTVYRFEADGNKPAKSTCAGQCLVAWPPLITDGTAVKVSAEIDSAKVGSLTRDDGNVQVTLNGWPLYLFAQDKAPGDIKGEGVNGKWSVVGADAKPLKPKA